ncbi:MAG TPA: alpha/beta hydrolase family protein [Pyrinomonadaceae bacterium]|nr:alpha/beta hydrolase family protein [Pyrinomonadaceae bacterium]
MTSRFLRILIILALAFLLSGQAQKPARVSEGQAQSNSAAEKSRVETVQFQSKLVGRTLPYIAVLPVDYDRAESKSRRYPVVYLLHGLFGHYTDWTSRTKLTEYAAKYPLIVITLEGNNGWYTDSATEPSEKYESYILEELLPDVEQRFRVSTERNGRAIAGLSMGGYGAMKFGLKHPEMFAVAASMSGAFSAATWTDIKDYPTIKASVMKTFGPAGSETRATNDVLKLARETAAKRVSLPYLYLDCGTEDFLIDDNREFMRLLVELKIPHEYRQLPGTHGWPYWDSQIQEVLKVAAKRLSA